MPHEESAQQAAVGYVLVEGHGVVQAAANLLSRLAINLELSLGWKLPIRWPNLHIEAGVRKGCRFIAGKGDADFLLLLRDEDDACPRTTAPHCARWVQEERLPFPTAIVLFHREYETLFLSCVDRLAGRPIVDSAGNERPGIAAGTTFDNDPESVRGVKEWLSARFPRGRIYKPTLDQLPLTRMLDLSVLRESGPPCFGTLQRALAFMAQKAGAGDTGQVYPPPETAS